MIDSMKVTKTGELLWDDRTDERLIEQITAALAAAGFTAEEADAPEETARDSAEDAGIEGLTISIPRADFTETALENLTALIASKHTLIKKALQADSLGIETDEEKVFFPW